MASSIIEEPPISANEANASPATMDAKIMVATGRVDCQQLKDLLTKEDPTTMVVVMASSHQTSKMKPRSSPTMNSRLLALACSGCWEELELLLNGEDCQTSSNGASRSSTMQRAYDDEEAFLRESLLNGVTIGGDTALHVVASYGQGDTFSTIYNKALLFVQNRKRDTPLRRAALRSLDIYGDGENFLKSAGIIYKKAEYLLFVQNNNGDTPLHCAARAGKSQMVSFLIRLAKCEDNNIVRLKALLETENQLKETALHEAVRIGNNDIVKLLMNEDPELACFPKDGASPLYLAVLLENNTIAATLYRKSNGNLSYSGPHGQNALHAAALRREARKESPIRMAEKLLTWNEDLTQVDQNGSTPLHFAASLPRVGGGFDWNFHRMFPWISRTWRPGSPLEHVLRANPQQLYQSDNEGLFPIHVAASTGAFRTLMWILKKYPSSAGLRDAKGRTFLHIAVEKRRHRIVCYACKSRPLSWILNMQDNNGNTALHIAVHGRSLPMFCALLGNPEAHMNIINEQGQTLLDISKYNIPRGVYYSQTSETLIHHTLLYIHARNGNCREDHFEEKYTQQVKRDKREEIESLKDSTQTLCIGSVLIATVTFGATFALPGGYRADDHVNGGTPTLVGRYAFHAFMMANTLAFLCSSIATVGLMYAGSSIIGLRSRKINLVVSVHFMSSSITSLTVAFASGVYMVLSPVARNTAIGICAISPLLVIYRNMGRLIKLAILARPLCIRMGPFQALKILARLNIILMFIECWPFIVIFGWATFAWNHRQH